MDATNGCPQFLGVPQKIEIMDAPLGMPPGYGGPKIYIPSIYTQK
jgi:hypothetical protein